MEISEERHGDVVVVRVADLPYGRRIGLVERVNRVLASDTEGIVFDLHRLASVNEPGFGEVIVAVVTVVRSPRRMAVVHPRRGGAVRRSWDWKTRELFAGPDSIWRSYESLDDALEFLRD